MVELCSSLLLLLSNIFQKLKSATYTDSFAKSVAFSEHALQSAGTFYQALLQQIYDSLVPILAGVISYLDTNDNLRLFQDQSLHGSKIPTKTLWSEIFMDKNNIFDHSDAILSSLPDGTGETRNHTEMPSHFASLFPFSWLVISHITDLLTTISDPGNLVMDNFVDQ